MSERDPLDQLSALRIRADDETRARDLEAIRMELRRRTPGLAVVRRRWTLGVVVAMMLAGPMAAVASDASLPGDLLYPIKRAVEPIIQLFDRDVMVEHRVEEVAALVDLERDDGLIQQRIDIARSALAETDVPRLEQELDRIVDRWVADRSAPAVSDPPSEVPAPRRDAPASDQRGREPEPASVDAPDSTTTTGARPVTTEPPPSDRTTTTAVPRETDASPPPDDRPRDTP